MLVLKVYIDIYIYICIHINLKIGKYFITYLLTMFCLKIAQKRRAHSTRLAAGHIWICPNGNGRGVRLVAGKIWLCPKTKTRL